MSLNTLFLLPCQASEQHQSLQFYSALKLALRPEEVLLVLSRQLTNYTVKQNIFYQGTTFLA